VCGVVFPEAGDLCPGCRRQAAEALRRAAAERAGRERGLEQERRQQEHSEAQRLERAQAEEDVRLREEAHRRWREEEIHRQETENALQQRCDPIAIESAGEIFDPYRILGVSRETGDEAIRAAYEEARLRFDETVVADLGEEVRRHYKEKAEAVEQAYRVLAGG
jgi:hypothetical protein